MSILAVLELKYGKVRPVSLSAITCARILSQKTGLPYNVALIGAYSDSAVDEVSHLGAQKVFLSDQEHLRDYTAENFKIAVVEIAKLSNAKYIISVASSFGKDFMPRVAARLGASMLSEIIEVIDGETFKRTMYAGSIIATVKIKSEIKVLTVKGIAFEKAEKVSSRSDVQKVEVKEKFEGKKFLELRETKSTRPELTEASVVVSVGRGIKAPENIKIAEELADVLGAAIGASRAVVDAGWLPNDYQVGQTGKTVAPQLYVAMGISGAIQHVAGMKDSKFIVAINKDPEAPIFQIADVGLVSDLFQAVPELTQKLRKLKEQNTG